MMTESQPVRSFEQRIPRKLFLLGFLAILVSLTIEDTLYDGENLLFRLESFKELTP